MSLQACGAEQGAAQSTGSSGVNHSQINIFFYQNWFLLESFCILEHAEEKRHVARGAGSAAAGAALLLGPSGTVGAEVVV